MSLLTRLQGLLAVICLLAAVSFAQTMTGMIEGTVEDATGAKMPAVAVLVANEATSQTWQARSDEDGAFRVLNLPFGAYRVEIAHPGFEKQSMANLRVEAGRMPKVAAVLKPSGVAEQVTISAADVTLQTSNATQFTSLSARELVELPTASRNYTHLIVADAGVAAPLPDRTGRGLNLATTPGDQAEDGTQSLNPSVNGARPTNNALRLNGIDATNLLSRTGSLGNNLNVPLDAVEVVEVQKALYSAVTGRNGGANVEVATKSGGNNFHGAAYHYLQNEKFNANEFFLNRAGTARPKFRRNETGTTLGGPVFRDRTFFFAAVQRTDFQSGYASNAIAATGIPTLLGDLRTPESIAGVANEWLRTGAADNPQFAANFLRALQAFPADQVDGLIRQFFADPQALRLRVLTAADIHPVAINILNTRRNGQLLIPTPAPGLSVLQGNGTYGREYLLQQVIPTKFNSWSGAGSLQHSFGSKNRARLQYTQSSQFVEEAFGWADASPSPTLGDNSGYMVSLSDEHTFSPTWVNDFRVGYFSLSNTRIAKYRDIKNSTLGIYNPLEFAIGGLAALMPTIDINTQRNSGGIGNAWDFFDKQLVLNFVDTVSYIRGSHSMQFGGEYRNSKIGGEYMSRTNGDLDYDNWALFFTGHGAAGGGSDLDQGDTRRNFRAQDLSFYFQDNWKARRNLTLNLGLRYDFFGNLNERDGRVGNYYTPEVAARLGVEPGFQVPAESIIFQPGFTPLQIGLYVEPGTPTDLGQVHRAKYESTLLTDRNNFAPRFGFAWQPGKTEQLVVRGGYGLFYERTAAGYKVDLQRAAPFFLYQNVPAPPDMADPYPRLYVNPFQIPLNVRIARDSTGAASWVRPDGTRYPAQSPFSTKSNVFIDPFVQAPHVHQWSLNVQYEVLPNIILDTRYVGSSGVRLIGRVNLAFPVDPRITPVNGFTDIRDSRGRVISPDFFVAPEFLGLNRNGGFQLLSNWGHSTYHALQTEFRGRLGTQANWRLAYTLSKSLDNFSADTSLAEHNARDIDNNRGVSNFDRTHRLTAAYVVDLPSLTNQGAALRAVLGGWKVSGLLTWQSGAPFSVLGNSTVNAVFAQPTTVRMSFAPGRTAADAEGSGRIQDRLDSFFDTTAFTDAPESWGDTARNLLRGPRQAQLDFTLGKQIKLREQLALDFRWELYNAFNTPTFANPASTYAANGPGNAGRITSTVGGPRTMQAAVRLQF